MGGERIYPSNRCHACPFGPAAERVRGSRGSQRDMRGAINGNFDELSIKIILASQFFDVMSIVI